jgi:hypothetical protein
MRNREIQRRSRARRKDYIEDLEKRVRQYERDGIKVTAEVQAAARKVAEENHWLHSLLAKHGISPAEIKEHLDCSRAASHTLDPKAATVTARNTQPRNRTDYHTPRPAAQVLQSSPRPSAPPTADRGSDVGLLSPTSTLGSPDHENVLYTVDNPLPEDDDAQHTNVAAETSGNRSSFEGPSALCPPCRAPEQDAAFKGADETSCEDAARIIASMRGHEDPEGVWPELGCSSTRSCMVKNIAIFSMVDQGQ